MTAPRQPSGCAEIVSLKDYRALRGLPPTRLERAAAVENMRRDPAAFMKFMGVAVYPWQVESMRRLTQRYPPPRALWRPGFEGPVDLRGESTTLCVVDELSTVPEKAWRDPGTSFARPEQEPFKEPR